jgi:hypothetical protein
MIGQTGDDDSYFSQIYTHLDEKDTDELLEIWRKNDRSEWTDEAFNALGLLLLQRVGKLPEQGPPLDEHDAQLYEEEQRRGLYPAERRLIWIAELARNLSWVNLVLAVAYAVYRLFRNSIPQAPAPAFGFVMTDQGLGSLFSIADSLILAGVIFVLLQAVAEIIYLLMDIRELVEPEETEQPGDWENETDPTENG